jgi:hypothetical protein
MAKDLTLKDVFLYSSATTLQALPDEGLSDYISPVDISPNFVASG